MIDGPRLVAVPGGSVVLRDARTRTERMVAVAPFEIGATALTLPEASSETLTPLAGLTWFDAVARCNELSARAGLPRAYRVEGEHVDWDPSSPGFRLPTEAEWEYAARAGSPGARYGPLAEIAWSGDAERATPPPVGQRKPNAWGVFDALGGVWEWTWDRLDPRRYGDYRVLRGGGWADPPWSVRAGVRRGSAPDAHLDDVGMRVARGALPPGPTSEFQGWSPWRDADRARAAGPLPLGWTPGSTLSRRG